MVRLVDIARECGFSVYTVSCVLNNRGKFAEETRRIVKETAKRMEYKGNAAAAILASQRQKQRNRTCQLRIAWIGRREIKHKWLAFSRACDVLGYDGEFIHVYDYESPKNLVHVLWSRGFSGMVLHCMHGGWSEEDWLNADWDQMSVVKIHRGFPRLQFHVVRHSAFDYMFQTLSEVWRRGYRRIGVLMVKSPSDIDDYARIGALHAFREKISQKDGHMEFRTFPEIVSGKLDSPTMEWLSNYKPDALIGFPHTWINTLKRSGITVPEQMAFATPYSQIEGGIAISGCDSQEDALAHRSAYLLHTLIQMDEKGMTQSFLQDVIVPCWLEHGTLPDRSLKK